VVKPGTALWNVLLVAAAATATLHPPGRAGAATNNVSAPSQTASVAPRIAGGAQTGERCGRPDAVDGSELCAQWVAANAAREAAEIANRSLKWNVGAFLALLATLAATAWSAWAAMRAAQAADRSVQLSEAVAGAQLRAYLLPGTFTLTSLAKGRYRITVPTRNSGQTPARNITLRIGHAVVACPLPFPLPDIDLADPMNFHAIAPGTERMAMLDFTLSTEEVAEIGAGEAAVICRICYSYQIHDGRLVEEPIFDMMAHGEDFATERMTVIPPSYFKQATQS
jgi:hypothetical protein